ncbi:MAG: hypothetical protein J3Q66DRAFT_351825 [Benniella sp.]|nr:MAG: hypothetical protein J3Q66DRAFT_351825 [Benniella sp.]
MKFLAALLLLGACATVGYAQCARSCGDCPRGTHCVNKPMICREYGFPPDYHFVCLGGIHDKAPVVPQHNTACVRGCGDCPSGTHCENEPDICRDIGYPPNYHLLCVGGGMGRRCS